MCTGLVGEITNDNNYNYVHKQLIWASGYMIQYISRVVSFKNTECCESLRNHLHLLEDLLTLM